MENKSKDIKENKHVTTMEIKLPQQVGEFESQILYSSQTGSTSTPEANNTRKNDKAPASIDSFKNPKVVIFGEDIGPKFYPVKGKVVTPVIITKNIPEAYKFMPIYGKPNSKEDLEEFQWAKVRQFVGTDLNDEDYNKLAYFCSPNHLKVGTEIKMSTKFPTHEHLTDSAFKPQDNDVGDNLCIVKKQKLRLEKDAGNVYAKQFKYRGVRCFPPPQESADYKINLQPLEPGKDLVFRVRVYRSFCYSGKQRNHSRHSVFSNDIVLLGRLKLTELRDRFVCANDVGTRTDISENPDEVPVTSAKEMFPSGFLFINNVFYVDTRQGCKDISKIIREWASLKGMGDFPHKNMKDFSLDAIPLKLGHPEVYVHQGNCEHLFTFSEVRLHSASDPLQQSLYPYHTAVSQNQILYCTTCAEFGARWIVTNCEVVPFEPGYFCDTCFKLYLYKDGVKITDFKAYSYKGNEINPLKPLH